MSRFLNASKLPRIENNHRQRIISKFKAEMISHPELTFGFSLFWIWVWIVFQSDLLSQTIRLASVSVPFWMVPLLSYAIGFFVLGSLFKIRRIVPHGKLYLIAVALCMTLGAFIMSALGFFGHQGDDLYQKISIFCGFLMGCGTAGLHVEWGRVFGTRGTHATIIHGIMGTIGAAFLYWFLHMLPPIAIYICAVCVPSLCLLTLRRSLKENPKIYKYGVDAKLYIPWKFIITSLIHGISFGVMWTALLLLNQANAYVAINVLSFALAAIGVFCTALLFRMDFNHLIYHVAFPLIAISYLLLPVFGSSILIGSTVSSIGVHFLSILLWTLCVYLIINRRISANWVFTWTTGSYIFGQTLGVIVSTIAISNSDNQINSLFILSIVMVFVILSSALFMINNNNLNEGWGMVKPGEESTKVGKTELACMLISNEYGLTPREEEVLVLLAKGRNRAVISKQLYLASNTVKTHMRNIYRKTSINSQQELMNLVERKTLSFSDTDSDVPTTAF